MASFTPPPSSQLQPFTVPAPQQSDPLESLARLRQNRLQIVQSQKAQMELESQQGALQAYKEAGGDIDAMIKIAPKYNVLPGVITALQKNQADLIQTRAQTKLYGTQEEKARLEAQDQEHDLLYQAYSPIWEEKDPDKQQATIDAINKRLVTQGWDPKKLIQPDTDVHLAKSSYNTWKNIQAMADKQARDAQIKASEANVKQSEAATKKTGKEMDKMDLAAAISAIQAAPVDEKTGTPTPAALAGIRKKFPDIPLGGNPTKADIDRFIRSGVDVEKQPEYDINVGMAASGMTGKTQWDQHLFQNSKAIGKKPNELTPAEFNAIRAKYVEDNPLMQALLVQQKQLNVKQLQNTLDRTLTPDEIESFGKDFVDLNLSPDMQAVFRSRGDNAYPQILLAAKKEAAKRGIPFSPTAWETKYKTWQRTENEFATGKESDQIQSFGNLMNHAAFLYDAKNALFQNDIPVLRRIAAALGVASGGSAETVFGTIAGFVADEATKAFLGSAGGVEERANRAAKFDVGLGNQQITDNLKALMHLADSQRIQLESKYEKGTFGKGERIGQLFSQDTLNARDKVMGKATGGKISVPLKSGRNGLFDTQEQADKFKRDNPQLVK